jgi:hypothetical protein
MPEYDVTIYLKPVTVTADDPGQAVDKAAGQVQANVLGGASQLTVIPKVDRPTGFQHPAES